MITSDIFNNIFPNADDIDDWVEVLNNHLPDYNINTPERVAAFISQCGVETAGWTKFEENMNYSADRMMVVWPKIFNRELANQCNRKPQLVANFAYANRMGNGSPESGDGWKYRGRGLIHLTGKKNYTSFATDTFGERAQEIIDNPDLVVDDKNVSLATALWFWDINNINSIADQQDIKRITRIVNGGLNGFSERVTLYGKVLSLLQ